MATLTQTYASSASITITLASLATDSNLLAGRESDWIDNSSNKYVDALLSGTISVGTSPTTAKQIEVHVIGIFGDSSYPDVFDGTDSNETITSAGIKGAICKPACIIATESTSDRAYPFGPVSVASLFGGLMPKSWGVFVVHNTGVNLKSSGHSMQYVGVKYDIA